ncbi:MAG: prolipoprotein diacylglyceryl transferase [Bacteroidales bacterium]|nr:prolipoprotein diacylglyceryl transferase [Bacteroidales bacterium]
MVLDYIHWNVNPQIFHIGSLSVRWYGLLFALAFYFGYIIIKKMFEKEKIPAKLLDSLLIYMFLGTIIGARLGHCLFYEPHYYLSNPIKFLEVWEGGLASHGAAIGILLALYLFSRKYKMPYFWILDRIVVVVALAGVLIRTGNLMNSEIFGIQTSLPWAFIFDRVSPNIPRHPTQIYEALAYLFIFIFLIKHYYKKNGAPKQGFLFAMFLILIFTARFFIEYLKVVQVNFENNYILNLGQALSIPFIAIGFLILIVINKKKKTIQKNL